MENRTNSQIHEDVTNQYSAEAAELEAWIELFVETYRKASNGDEEAMAKATKMYNSTTMNEHSFKVQAALNEAGLS